jgi:hypothetical protein
MTFLVQGTESCEFAPYRMNSVYLIDPYVDRHTLTVALLQFADIVVDPRRAPLRQRFDFRCQTWFSKGMDGNTLQMSPMICYVEFLGLHQVDNLRPS